MTPYAAAVVPGSQERRRKLHLGHFAFLRGVVQGLPMRDMWNRYVALEGSADD